MRFLSLSRSRSRRPAGTLVRPLLLLGLAAGLQAAQAEGTVEVSFVDPQHFSDAGVAGSERDRNLHRLEAAMKQVAAPRLADGQTLRLDVLDVDLAGTVKQNLPTRDLRIVTGGADVPRLTLRYTLEQNGQVLQRGEDRLTDLDYLHGPMRASDPGELSHERRMFAQWMQSRFGAAAGGRS